MSVHIRAALEVDLPAIRELAVRSFPLACPPATAARDIAAYIESELSLERFRSHFHDRSCSVLVAEVDGTIGGYAMLRPGPVPAAVAARRPIELYRFYVAREHHGDGTARALMEGVLGRTRDGEHDCVWLSVSVENARARRFYEKSGFRQAGSRVFRVGGDDQQDAVMVRSAANEADRT